jgi:hypothetical protein
MGGGDLYISTGWKGGGVGLHPLALGNNSGKEDWRGWLPSADIFPQSVYQTHSSIPRKPVPGRSSTYLSLSLAMDQPISFIIIIY